MSRLVLLLLCAGLTACRTTQPPSVSPDDEWETQTLDGATLWYTPPDRSVVAPLKDDVSQGQRTITAFFGKPFPAPLAVRVFPSRAALTAHWRAAWGFPELETACWMVGSGDSDGLTLLSPRVWPDEACEHDPADTTRIRQLVTHELVHTFHDQVHPAPNFDELEPIGWFVEGLATYVSGQLDGTHLANPREAIETGEAPESLETAWSGKYRYGVSGTLVRFIDQRYGRDMLVRLLGATTEEDILSALDMSEPEFLAAWRAAVLAEE